MESLQNRSPNQCLSESSGNTLYVGAYSIENSFGTEHANSRKSEESEHKSELNENINYGSQSSETITVKSKQKNNQNKRNRLVNSKSKDSLFT